MTGLAIGPMSGNNMATFLGNLKSGVREDLDPRERQRLREYEYHVAQKYHSFHEKCGKNVFLSDKKLVAARITDGSDGVVFSAKPIPLGGMFQVKLLEITGKDDHWAKSLVSAQSNLSHLLYTYIANVARRDNFEQSVIPFTT